MAFEVVGKLHELYEEQQVSEKFKKREFVLEIDDNSYTQYIKFQATQDRCSTLNPFKKGDNVKVQFNLKGRPYTSKTTGEPVYFTNLEAWRIESAGGGSQKQEEDYMMPDNFPAHDDSDIPF